MVAEMSRLGWRVDGRGWKWRRRLFAREEEQVVQCDSLFDNIFFLHDNVLHKWIRKHDHDVDYCVNCIYSILNQNDEMGNNLHNDII
jgi:hypothetical protein